MSINAHQTILRFPAEFFAQELDHRLKTIASCDLVELVSQNWSIPCWCEAYNNCVTSIQSRELEIPSQVYLAGIPLDVSGTFRGSRAANASDDIPESAVGFVNAAADAAPAGVWLSGRVGVRADAMAAPRRDKWQL